MESLNISVQPFFEWLLRATFQASLLICLILLLQVMLRGKLGPRWCHALWLLLLIRMVMPWAPQSRASIFNLIPRSIPSSRAEYARDELTDESSGPAVTDVGTSDTSSVAIAEVPQETPKAPTETAVTREKIPSRLKPAFLEAAKVLPLIWLAGAMALAIYVCANNFALLRIVRRERPLTDQKILDLLEDCKAEMGIRTILGVVPTDNVKSPALFGFVRPRLLLPAGMLEGLSHEELRYVFLHELAHLKRHDIYIGWLTSILQVLHWFNPLIWLAFYRMRADRELACDALVLARTQSGQAKDYGRTIVSLLERFSRPQPLPSMAGILETKAQLKRRITMIAQFKKTSYKWSPLAVILIIVIGCVSLPNAKRTKASGISAAKSGLVGAAQETGPVIRELKIERHPAGGLDLSRDGNKLVFCRLKDKKQNLILRDLISGEETEITNHATGHTVLPVFSPDGREIAYTLMLDSGDCPLHIISLQTGQDRSLDYDGFSTDWSRDGRLIVTFSGELNKENTYGILSISADMVKKVNLSLPGGEQQYSDLQFSPDAKYVSYARKGNLYLYPIHGGDEIQITHGSNGDMQPFWSPDGKMLVFLSRRGFGPELDLCGVPVFDGKAAGGVRIIKPDFGDDVWLSSLSETGGLFYERSYTDEYVYLMTIDPQTGKPTSEPTRLTAGSHSVWSPDGKRIAYVAKGVLHVMSADGSNDQEIMKVKFHPTGTYTWAPDNDHIYIPEYRRKKIGIYVISLTTKERRDVLLSHENIKRIVEHLTCSPDGKRLAFIGQPTSSKKLQVFVADVDGTNVRQLTFDETSNKYYPAWSPDGKEIAFEWSSGGIWRLMVVSVDDGSTREVFQGKTKQDRFYRKSWSPDGSKIAWIAGWMPGDDGTIGIGQVSNGKYSTFKVSRKNAAYACDWSSDGNKMLLSIDGSVDQLMIMENFLPADE